MTRTGSAISPGDRAISKAASAAIRFSIASAARKMRQLRVQLGVELGVMLGDPVGGIEEDRLGAQIGLRAAVCSSASRASKQRRKCGSGLAQPLTTTSRSSRSGAEGERQAGEAAGGMADETGARQAERVHQREHVVGHVVDGNMRSGSARSLRPVPRWS